MMRAHWAVLALAPVCVLPARTVAQDTISLRPGLVITRSVRVVPRTYHYRAPASLDSALITIQGDSITVDFQGASLEGADPTLEPDRAAGVAILVEGGRRVRIVNARIRGYKIAILARGTRAIGLEGNDLSYNWKPRLYSLVEHESLVDWLSFHHNEKDEWLRFGAAIYLRGVRGGEIRGNRVRQGMNGLLLVRSDSLQIEDNDFSFNSGLGIGLYRSSDNTILHNTLDYNVRGYSHGFYRRGQDSAGLLLYEQSCRNVVAFNSLTHGGDGVFLWAGQSTMDSGSGGANDNLFYGNDVSFAPANGIEATFSRNTIVANRAWGSEYGVWGGYSFATRIVGNDFRGNRFGIAIEHGQDNVIERNRFSGDSIAVRLWADSIEPSDWGYPTYRDTRSRDYRITGNVFVRNRVALRARDTHGLTFAGNRWMDVDSLTVLRDTAGFHVRDNLESSDTTLPAIAANLFHLPSPRRAVTYPISELTGRDRSAIVVDEWGPYDWRSPKLWPVAGDSTRAVPLRLAVLGPPGRWRVVARRGIAQLSAAAGRMGDTLTVTPAPDSMGDWALTLEYRGGATVSPRGLRHPAGQPYRFSYGRFEPRAVWTVRYFAWTDSTDPTAGTPLLTQRLPRLDYMWYRPPRPPRPLAALPAERWALEATATVTLPPGTYALRTISDDAVRVWVDGALVIDNWTPHESAVDMAPLAPGRHALRVQYYQVGGWTELRLEIEQPQM